MPKIFGIFGGGKKEEDKAALKPKGKGRETPSRRRGPPEKEKDPDDYDEGDDDSDEDGYEVFNIKTIDDLPTDERKALERARIPDDKAQAHLDMLCNVLCFIRGREGKKFYYEGPPLRPAVPTSRHALSSSSSSVSSDTPSAPSSSSTSTPTSPVPTPRAYDPFATPPSSSSTKKDDEGDSPVLTATSNRIISKSSSDDTDAPVLTATSNRIKQLQVSTPAPAVTPSPASSQPSSPSLSSSHHDFATPSSTAGRTMGLYALSDDSPDMMSPAVSRPSAGGEAPSPSPVAPSTTTSSSSKHKHHHRHHHHHKSKPRDLRGSGGDNPSPFPRSRSPSPEPPKEHVSTRWRMFTSPGNYWIWPRDAELATKKLLIQEDPKDVFRMFDMEGKGGYGRVFAAKSKSQHTPADKQQVAIKKMSHMTEREKCMNLHEIGLLSFLRHPNLVRYRNAYFRKEDEEVWLVMEYMEGGTLKEATHNFQFNENQIAYVAQEMLKGIQYLHGYGLVHRDLKSANIMLTLRGEVKLIDFGLCVDLSVDKEECHMCGSPFWMCPEMIRGDPHGPPADIWSLGVSIVEMLLKTVPNFKSRLKVMFTVATTGIQLEQERGAEKWSNELKDFLGKCLQVDPVARPTATTLLTHPFLKKASTLKEIRQILPVIFLSNTMVKQGIM